jgi:hypothetical protein
MQTIKATKPIAIRENAEIKIITVFFINLTPNLSPYLIYDLKSACQTSDVNCKRI